MQRTFRRLPVFQYQKCSLGEFKTNLHSVQLFVPFRKPERGMSDGDI